MQEATRIYFAVFNSDPNAANISSVVGREPSRFSAIGESRPAGKTPRKVVLRTRSIWTIESGLDKAAEIEEQLEALLNLLEEHADGVRNAAALFDAGISCLIIRESATPGFHLSQEHVTRIAALTLSIDFDIYAVPSDEESQDPDTDSAPPNH